MSEVEPTEKEAEILERFYNEDEEVDPTECPNTNLETVPESATISYRSGQTRDTQLSFIIERAMLDPEAEVVPYTN